MPVLANLSAFAADVGQDLHGPQRKWLHDMLFGMLASGSPILADVARSLGETGRDGNDRRLIHTEKRLSRNLNSDRFDDARFLQRLRERAQPVLSRDDGEGVIVAVDYTDISKPYAKLEGGMEGVCMCHDGSEGTEGIGYPVVQVTGLAASDATRWPLVLHAFTFREGFTSQNEEFRKAFEAAAPYVGKRAWWALDRGFDGTPTFNALDAVGARWVIRVNTKGVAAQRLVQTESGETLSLGKLALAVQTPWSSTRKEGRVSKAWRFGIVRIRMRDADRKSMPFSNELRTLIVFRGPGGGNRAVLVSEALHNRAEALAVSDVYLRRWQAEEQTRQAKDSRGWGVRLEDLRALKLAGVRRLCLLAMAVMTFLAEAAGALSVKQRVAVARQTFGSMPRDVLYRLTHWLARELASLMPSVRARWRAWASRFRTGGARSPPSQRPG